MKNSGRMKLYMSIGLAIMLVIQMIVFMFLRPDTLNMVLVLFGLIVMIGIFAILMNYYHLKKTEERVQDLPADYKSFYIDANEAIGLSSMKRGNKNDTMLMILEILEHANEDNRNLVDVIGPNPRTSPMSACFSWNPFRVE